MPCKPSGRPVSIQISSFGPISAISSIFSIGPHEQHLAVDMNKLRKKQLGSSLPACFSRHLHVQRPARLLFWPSPLRPRSAREQPEGTSNIRRHPECIRTRKSYTPSQAIADHSHIIADPRRYETGSASRLAHRSQRNAANRVDSCSTPSLPKASQSAPQLTQILLDLDVFCGCNVWLRWLIKHHYY